MKLTTKVAALKQIIEPAVLACDVSLWGIEFTPQGKRSLLRIYIDMPKERLANGENITVDHCTQVTHQVSGVLDVHDPIAGEYILEVSSPGLDRHFFTAEQLADYVGQTLALRLIAPVANRRKMTGELLNINDTQLQLKLGQADKYAQISVVLNNIDKAQLVYQY